MGKKLPLSLVVHNLRSMYNVGALFRLAEALQMEKVYLCGWTPYPPRQKIAKVARHTVEKVNWEYNQNTKYVLKKLQQQNTHIIALEQTHNSKNYHHMEYQFPLALVVGFEVEGIEISILDNVDQIIEIPMLGENKSLNVAVAAGVVSYHLYNKYIH